MENLETSNPQKHARNIKSGLKEVADHMRRDVAKIDDPKAEALFETSAEVLEGLIKAFTHFEEKSEDAWK